MIERIEPRRGERRPRRRRGFSWLKLIFYTGVVGFVLGVIAIGAFAVYVIRVTEDLPTIEALHDYEPPVMTRVHAGDGRLIAEYARESRVFVPIETIPPELIQAFVAAEDRNFYDHNGVDPVGMVRAGIRNVVNRVRGRNVPLQGGSTITQQVAKNFLLSSEQTLVRKIREIALAMRIEEAFSKDEILELYLNEIYLGRRSYGVAAAALLYFGTSLDDLRLSQMAYLAALPRAPNNYHPTRNPEQAIARRNYVLARMVVNGYITQEEADEAGAEPLEVVDRLEGETYTAAEYFVEEVRRRIFAQYGEDELYDGGLSIRTTLDTQMQVQARDALRSGLEDYDRRHGYRGPIATIELGEGWAERLAEVELAPDIDNWVPAVVLSTSNEAAQIGLLEGEEGSIPLAELEWARRVQESGGLGPSIGRASQALNAGEVVYVEALNAGDESEDGGENSAEDADSDDADDGLYGLRQIPEVNGAIMAMDPHTGRVLAMVGGYSFRQSQFNRVVQARRQPGSSFKPFVYAAALDTGMTPATRVLDGPYVSTATSDGSFYRPENYTAGRWYGLQTLRVGIEQSRNTMTVRLANLVGLDHVADYGNAFGIYDDMPPYEAMALGAGETTLWRMVTGYSMLVNGGLRIEPTVLDRVQDRTGATIYTHHYRACPGCDVEAWDEIVEPVLPDEREPVVEPVTAYQIVSMLEGVVQRGTARRLRALGFPVAGKTGTTNDYRDAWFVGFTPDLTVGVYVGFDSPRSMGAGEAGGRVAAPIFQYFMGEAMADRPAIPFRIPEGVRLVRIDSTTGALARPGESNTVLEAFRPGTEPNRYGVSDDDAAGSSTTSGGISIGGGDVVIDDSAPPPGLPGLPGQPGETPSELPPGAVSADDLLAEGEGEEEEEEEDLGGLY